MVIDKQLSCNTLERAPQRGGKGKAMTHKKQQELLQRMQALLEKYADYMSDDYEEVCAVLNEAHGVAE